jgi:hypothetical protein
VLDPTMHDERARTVPTARGFWQYRCTPQLVEPSSPVRSHRFLVLFLAALGLVPGGAHVLEMPVKLRWDGATYAAVTSTLYRWFGFAGSAIQVAAAAAAIALAYRARGSESFGRTAAGAAALVLSIVVWATLVAPVNARWGRALAGGGDVARSYVQLRPIWEWGHVAAFAAWLSGFVLLLAAQLDSGALSARSEGRGRPGAVRSG